MSLPRQPVYFISHGGGPWPYMPEMRAMLRTLEQSLQQLPRQLPARPQAVLMVSGHWEEPVVAVSSGANPPMLYDYSGFPPHTYEVRYPAPGAPALAARVQALLAAQGIAARLDPDRGFDHGSFTPMVVMYPEADMPLVQLSLQARLDPAEHLALGRAIAPLRDEGVLIVGSGLSYHNLRLMGPGARKPSAEFDAWLQQTLALPPAERSQRLTQWAQAPSARVAHPREDHLLPLMVAVGAAEQARASVAYHDEHVFGSMVASSFRFDD